jgi:hypothetical protein
MKEMAMTGGDFNIQEGQNNITKQRFTLEKGKQTGLMPSSYLVYFLQQCGTYTMAFMATKFFCYTRHFIVEKHCTCAISLPSVNNGCVF